MKTARQIFKESFGARRKERLPYPHFSASELAVLQKGYSKHAWVSAAAMTCLFNRRKGEFKYSHYRHDGMMGWDRSPIFNGPVGKLP